MKKNYVKPMMESEAFVANEYVAACWMATCSGRCGAVEKGYESLKTRITSGQSYDDMYLYTGSLTDTATKVTKSATDCESVTKDAGYPEWADQWYERWFWNWILVPWFGQQNTETSYYHPVTLEEGWGKSHPKASV